MPYHYQPEQCVLNAVGYHERVAIAKPYYIPCHKIMQRQQEIDNVMSSDVSSFMLLSWNPFGPVTARHGRVTSTEYLSTFVPHNNKQIHEAKAGQNWHEEHSIHVKYLELIGRT